jgi:hypothetical protein
LKILNLTPKQAIELEKKLARGGNHEEARRVYKHRLEIDEKQALAFLAGTTSSPPELLKLSKRLAGFKRIGLSRRLLKMARKDLKKSEYPADYLEIFQKSALYTYKDPDLPLEWRLDHAMEILKDVEVLSPEDEKPVHRDITQNQETLGLAGAIYKRKWEVDGQRLHLERALFYYLRGYAQGAPAESRADVLKYLAENPSCQLHADEDRGYNGINAAFVLDLLAQEEEREARRAGLISKAARGRRESARLIREGIIRSVPPLRASLVSSG